MLKSRITAGERERFLGGRSISFPFIASKPRQSTDVPEPYLDLPITEKEEKYIKNNTIRQHIGKYVASRRKVKKFYHSDILLYALNFVNREHLSNEPG